MGEEEIIDNCLFFHLAGTDTQTYILQSMFYAISKNPQVIPKLKEEVDRIYKDGSNVTIDTINELDYLHACVMETLRMYPSIGFMTGSIALEDHMIGDIKV